MMSFRRALTVAKKTLPDKVFTGFAYKSGDYYYMELKDADNYGMPMDSMYKVNGITAKVTHYNPIIDGVISPSQMERVNIDL